MFRKDNYLKYDKGYWTSDRWKTVRKNILIYGLSCMIAFETYSVIRKERPWEAATDLLKRASYGVEALVKDFPLRPIAYARYAIAKHDDTPISELSDQLDDADTENDIRRQIQTDRDDRYSEIGGIVVKGYDGGTSKITFMPIESENKKFCKKILGAEGDSEELKKLFYDNEEKFKHIFGNTYDMARRQIESGINNDWAIKNAMDFYLSQSNHTYNLTDDQRIEQFYPFATTGKIIAFYHIHDYCEPPSQSDLDGSNNMRELVIVSEKDGFTLHDLRDGSDTGQIHKKWNDPDNPYR